MFNTCTFCFLFQKPVSSSKALPIKRGPVISTPSKGASPGPVSEHDVEQESRQTRSSKLATHRWLRSGSTNTTVTQAAARLRERMHKTMRSKVNMHLKSLMHWILSFS